MEAFYSCKECGVLLSTILEGPILETNKNYEDGKSHVPKGNFGICTEDFMTKFEGEFIIHLDDCINQKYTDDSSRKNGCCGYDGQDGANKLCINGHEIGTECSDCWMSHGVVLHKDKVMQHKVIERVIRQIKE